MPQRVYNNVEGHRLIDNNRTIEDVTKVGLPTIKHPTTSISASGMAMDVDMPNITHLEAMECTVYHNNGINCKYLGDPGKHTLEFRTVRQRYSTTKGEIEHESAKFRIVCIHTETQKGDIETGSPYGSTEKYSVLRYEEEIDGTIVTIVDAVAGMIRYNGKDYTDVVENMLK